MNILIINGSPKGEYSITLQTVRYLEQCFPKQAFTVLHAGQRIKALEKDFSEAKELLLEADLILFSYPVYTFIAPSQLHRFIELVKESGIDLSGKAATQITTSKHFYDVTAHKYIEENCADLGMNFIRGLSADMDDLLTEKGQKEARQFFCQVLWSMKNRIFEPVRVRHPMPAVPVTVPDSASKKTKGDVVIVTDCAGDETPLGGMIARFRAVLPLQSRVVNLREYPFAGGCLGCFHCAADGKCIYKDNFDEFLRNSIQTADAIIYAFTVKDHAMGSIFKKYDDRQFCNGHRTVTMGMPMGYLVDGSYHNEPNLGMIVEGRAEVGGNFLCGVATNETDPDGEIDRLSKTLVFALEHGMSRPQNFYGVGGMKIFRDLIWLMQGMMKADHRFYKEHGQYDFPQQKVGTLAKMYLVGALLSSPKIVSKMGNKMNEGMIGPYRKVVDSVRKKA